MTDVLYVANFEPTMFSEAPCVGRTGVFYSHVLEDINEAKSLCETCPHINPCLDYAISNHEPEGVWGGQLILRGHIVLRRNTSPGRGRRIANDLPVPNKYKSICRINKR